MNRATPTGGSERGGAATADGAAARSRPGEVAHVRLGSGRAGRTTCRPAHQQTRPSPGALQHAVTESCRRPPPGRPNAPASQSPHVQWCPHSRRIAALRSQLSGPYCCQPLAPPSTARTGAPRRTRPPAALAGRPSDPSRGRPPLGGPRPRRRLSPAGQPPPETSSTFTHCPGEWPMARRAPAAAQPPMRIALLPPRLPVMRAGGPRRGSRKGAQRAHPPPPLPVARP